jgi:glucose/arabinose dehydrogenase
MGSSDEESQMTTAVQTPQSTGAVKRPAPPARIPRGTKKVVSLRSPPPAEELPAFRASRIAGADFPSGLAAAPDGRIFYSELWRGRVRVIRRDGTVDPRPWADVNALYGIRWRRYYHGGLSGIAFDPEFAANHFVYVVTQVPHKRTGLPSRSLVLRFTEANGRGESPRVLFSIPARIFDNVYSVVFGPDGMLYVPSGFLGRSRPRGQDALSDLRGKILRVTRDGKAPGDNPYGARAPRVWAAGFKNAFDLAFVPGTSYAIAGESGPEAHDEINLVMPGNDYGYPAHQGMTQARGITPPLLDYGSDRTSPAGIVYYSGRRHPELRGRFLICENHGRGLLALRVDTAPVARLRNVTPLVRECTIDVIQTPDGAVVFSDSEAVYRLVRA